VLLPAFLPELPDDSTEGAAPSPETDTLKLDAFIRQRLGPEARDLYAETHGQVEHLLRRICLWCQYCGFVCIPRRQRIVTRALRVSNSAGRVNMSPAASLPERGRVRQSFDRDSRTRLVFC